MKMLTAERLTSLLRSGQLGGTDQIPAIDKSPALGSVSGDSLIGLLGWIAFVQP